jgi:hypothetical protein
MLQFVYNAGAYKIIRCRAFLTFFLSIAYIFGLVLGVGWGNNVLALAYLYNILFLCLRHTLGVGLAGGWVGATTSWHLRT